jgi:hypothetical protein
MVLVQLWDREHLLREDSFLGPSDGYYAHYAPLQAPPDKAAEKLVEKGAEMSLILLHA